MSQSALRVLFFVPTSEAPAGYFNFAVNLATAFGVHVLPLELAPAATTALAFLIQWVPFAIVLWGRSFFWNTPPRRLACCLVLLFSPSLHPSIWLTVLNSQIFCGLIAFLILCEDLAGASRRRRWVYRLLLLFCGLSGPYTSMLVPAFFVKARLERGTSPESGRHLTIAVMAAGIQLTCYVTTIYAFGLAPERLQLAPWPAIATGVALFHFLQPIFGHHLIEPLGRPISLAVMASEGGPAEQTLQLWGVVSLLAILCCGFYFTRGYRDRFHQLFVWSFAAVCTATAILGYGLPRQRYSVLPGLLILLALLAGSWSSTTPRRRHLCRVLLGIALAVGIATYRIDWVHMYDGTRFEVFGHGPGRPDWPEEVTRWHEEPRRALRAWPYSAAGALTIYLPRRGELREIGSALTAVEGFHLVADRSPAERRIALNGLPADFKVVLRGRSLRASRRSRVVIVLEDAGGKALLVLPTTPLPDQDGASGKRFTPKSFTVYFSSWNMPAKVRQAFSDTRRFVIRLENRSGDSTAAVSIDHVKIAPRIEGLLDSALPVKTFPDGLYHASPRSPLVQEATAVLALESLLRDGDLRHGAADSQRARQRWLQGAEGMRLRPSRDGPPTYRESIPFLLVALPFADLAGPSGVVAANAVLFLALAALAWRDRRSEGVAGRLFAAGAFFGTAALGFVFLPQSRVFEMVCLFLPVRLWVRGRLDSAGGRRDHASLIMSGALLATAMVGEPAWGLVLLTVAGDLAWRRRWRPLVMLLAAAAVITLAFVASSHLLLRAGTAAAPPDPIPATRQDDVLPSAEPGWAIRAWQLYAAPNGLVAGYPFVLLACLLFAREPEDRPRMLLASMLALLTNWIALGGAAVAIESPLGSPHFAALAPLFVLLPKRIGKWHAPAAAAAAWLLLTLAVTSSAWTPPLAEPAPSSAERLVSALLLAAVVPALLLVWGWGWLCERLMTLARARPRPMTWRALLIPAACLALVMAYGFWGFSYDDNFITYRYAKNVLDGEGLVYNQGERVLGTSAPGYALLLAGLAFLTRPLGVEVPHWGTLLALASIVAVTGLLGKAQHRSRTVLVGFAVLALTSPLNLRLLGSEAFPILALVVSAAHMLLAGGRGPQGARRDAVGGLLVGAAMCLRLDAGLAALVLGLVAWGWRRRFPIAFAATGLGVLAMWLIFLGAYFGRIVPNTLGGKTALQDVPYTLRQWQTLNVVLPAPGSFLFLLGVGFGLVVVWRRGLWRHPTVLALGLWVLAHEAAYRAVGVWFAPWYHIYLWHALLGLYALAAFEAGSWTAGLLRRRGAHGDAFASAFTVPLVLLAVVLVPSAQFVASSWQEPPEPRFRLYEEAGRYVHDRLDPESRILATEIGVFGYFGECRILDMGALVSPRFTDAKFAGSRTRLAARLQPDYILAGWGDPWMQEVLGHEAVRGRYEEVSRFTDAGVDLRLLRLRQGPGPSVK